MVHLISPLFHGIDDIAGFAGFQFTESSTEDLMLPASVTFAAERDAVLQSAREAWAFRISSKGEDNSNQYQSTRTAALAFMRDGAYCIAIDDDPAENILLTRAQEGYEANANGQAWLVSRSDALVQGMLERARRTQRVFPVLESLLRLSTYRSRSPYEQHPAVHAILGNDLAPVVATYLHGRFCPEGAIQTIWSSTLREMHMGEDHVDVRRVCVGGGGAYGFLDARGQCNDYGHGRARGVRNISAGNKE
jgi:hypothetical protein